MRDTYPVPHTGVGTDRMSQTSIEIKLCVPETTMRIREATEVLALKNIKSPDLEILRPDEKRYTCLLFQPSGPIFAGAQRIGILNQEEGGDKARDFLRLATQKQAHLAVTPEYFFPWNVLEAELLVGTKPAVGALWVLGCESIQSDALERFKGKVAEACEVIYEPVEDLAADRTLLDPVVLLFQTTLQSGEPRMVALVQFKTYPSRDDTFFEEGLLRRGTTVYKLRGLDGTLSVSTIICSDAFALTDALVPDLIDRSTLIHIQLNPDPRNSAYRQYRKTTFETDTSTSECHVVCLNWAGSVVQHAEDGSTEDWSPVAGSAWYCPDARCKHDDAVVLPNHELGLYYAYMEERRHALLFHYGEAVFELLVPKVVTKGKAVMANRNGPAASERYCWNEEAGAWQSGPRPADSGFPALLASNQEAAAALANVLPGASAIDVERLLALTAGTVNGMENWFATKEIDSCKIGSDEVVHRVTVALDNNPKAVGFRHARMEMAAELRQILDTHDAWPPQLSGVTKDAVIEWTGASPNFNVRSADGRLALIVHVGNTALPPRTLENVASKLTDLLRRAGGNDQTRLCVLYRRFGELKFATLPITRFDDALEDETDILAVEPQD